MEHEHIVRVQGKDHTIYLYPDIPFWFVPSPHADEVLRLWLKGENKESMIQWLSKHNGSSTVVNGLDVDLLMRSIEPPPSPPYEGRQTRQLNRLAELWFHITDACNLQCRHCLFSCKPGTARSLALDRVKLAVKEAYPLGCRLICFTGGEPLMYPGFVDLIKWLLSHEHLRIAILTNGLLLPPRMNLFKNLDRERIHFQVSLDGPEAVHDSLRGKGTFQKTTAALKVLVQSGIACSIAMAVNQTNVAKMAELIRIAWGLGVTPVHFMWHFWRGMGSTMAVLSHDTLIHHLKNAVMEARYLGVTIDNFEAMRAQVFSPPGSRFDLSNGAWESLAVGPSGGIYPTPAMVGVNRFRAGFLDNGIVEVWRKSPFLQTVRRASMLDHPEMAADPWRFIIGGGDLDHWYLFPKGAADHDVLGIDPYIPVYREMAMMLIEQEASSLSVPPHPGLILRMGDITTDCPSGDTVNFTHCNCLLSVGEGATRGLVRQFYTERAVSPDEAIINPVHYDEEEIGFIPEEARVRMYGCGSPVLDADLKPGEVVVDLGSGTGVECFIAAKLVGPDGKVIGVDMTDRMLEIARWSQQAVSVTLGYDNASFIKGYLEAIPLMEGSADVIISNCVVNLSQNKRRVFQEILRILKPGGRLVISDVVAETEPPLFIRADHQLTGECIGGAMVQDYLFGMLREIGFVGARILKRFPYRTVQSHSFYSLTFSAASPLQGEKEETSEVIYAGPFRAVISDQGSVLSRGARMKVDLDSCLDPERLADAGLFILDSSTGEVTNVDSPSGCACFTEPLKERPISAAPPETGCLICGASLVYFTSAQDRVCARCGREKKANAACEKGHFVCDLCHIHDPIEVIRQVCTTTTETDMLRLLKEIRAQDNFPLHGPEHHCLIPGIILATFKNRGGNITDKEILMGIERGALVPGGSCAFMGICGAAVGVGIGFSIIMGATPLTPGPRKKIQQLTGQVIGRIAKTKAARCCQRECYLALKEAAKISEHVLPVRLSADEPLSCHQYAPNKECIKEACMLYPMKQKGGFSLELEDLRLKL